MFGRHFLLARNSHYQIMGRKLCTKRHYCCLHRLAIIARCPNTRTGYLRGGGKYLDQQYADVSVSNARCGFEELEIFYSPKAGTVGILKCR